MTNKVSYEWVFEEYDEHGDIIDPLFYDHFPQAQEQIEEFAFVRGHTCAVALVRDLGSAEEGLVDRGYAYVSGTSVPDLFDNGETVPQRFKKQVATYFKSKGGVRR